MKIREDYLLRQISNEWFVIPLRQASVKLNGVIKLNDTGAFLWKCLEQSLCEKELEEALTQKYRVSLDEARKDVAEFLESLKKIDCLED